MAKFKTPYSGKQTITGDKIKLEGRELDKISSPYDGVVEVASGDEIIIKHKIDGKTIYSNFKNVGTILTSRGQNVTSGSPLGRFGSNPIEFYFDDGSKILNTGEFFKKTFGKSENAKEPKNSKENNKNVSYSTDFSKNPELTVAHKMALDAIGLPLSIAKDLAGDIVKPIGDMAKGLPSKLFPKGKNESYDISLNEQIERIKNLMK